MNRLERFRSLGLAVAMACASTACAATAEGPAFVLVNRSDVPIAIYPGSIVAPCSTLEFTDDEVRAGNERRDRAFGDDSWVPEGAVRLDRGVDGRPAGSTVALTLVVSAREPQLLAGRPDDADLPPCGGEPLGIE